MTKTKIDWADEVFNPTTGCTKVSEGCRHCYAERIANRFWGERKFTDVKCHPERLNDPVHWKKPRRVFVDSMSDLFHEKVPDYFIYDVMGVIRRARAHTFIVLTKRPYIMFEIMEQIPFVMNNLWLGVSVEDQKSADERIPWLLKTNAAVRVVSVEPMLEGVNLAYAAGASKALWDLSWSRKSDIGWVICGCESGPGARHQPPYIDFRNLKNQCVKAGIPFFLKQMMNNSKKLVHMPELDGQVWNQYPGGCNER